MLRDRETLVEALEFGNEQQLPTLDLWSNIRLFRVDETWSLMDTVGNDQLDIPDQEACVRGDTYDFREVDGFLRNVSLYLLREGEVVEDGDTMDGPGMFRGRPTNLRRACRTLPAGCCAGFRRMGSPLPNFWPCRAARRIDSLQLRVRSPRSTASEGGGSFRSGGLPGKGNRGSATP